MSEATLGVCRTLGGNSAASCCYCAVLVDLVRTYAVHISSGINRIFSRLGPVFCNPRSPLYNTYRKLSSSWDLLGYTIDSHKQYTIEKAFKACIAKRSNFFGEEGLWFSKYAVFLK